jgi:hypothetical protein
VLRLLNAAPSSLPPVSEISLARSSDRVALLVGFPPILLEKSVNLSIVDIFLVSLFQSLPIRCTKGPHPANDPTFPMPGADNCSNDNLLDALLAQPSPGLTQYTGCTLSSIHPDLPLHF